MKKYMSLEKEHKRVAMQIWNYACGPEVQQVSH